MFAFTVKMRQLKYFHTHIWPKVKSVKTEQEISPSQIKKLKNNKNMEGQHLRQSKILRINHCYVTGQIKNILE